MTTVVHLRSFKMHLVAFQLVSLFCFGMGINNFGQPIRFEHVASNDRANFGNVWAITEDHEGFMWFGTEDGLYKYDGYDITPYQHNKLDSGSISGNLIVCLYEDKHDNLWIGTYGDGLNVYDRKKNIFYRFRHDPADKYSLPSNRIKTILESSNGTLWIGTEGGGLTTVTIDDEKLTNIRFNTLDYDTVSGIGSRFIRSIVENQKTKDLYIGTVDKGIYIIDQKGKKIQNFQQDKTNTTTLCSNQILRLFFDSKNRLWVGTANAGIDLYLPDKNMFQHYPPANNPHAIADKEVENIIEDKRGMIWTGTDYGLSMLVDSKQAIPKNFFENYRHQPFDEFSLLSNAAKALYIDSRKALWVGTYFGGVNVYDPEAFKFHPLHVKPWVTTGLSDNNVTAFAEDKNGNLWIGTDAGGLNYLPNAFRDIYQDNYQHIPIRSPKTGKLETKIKSIAVDKNNFVWIGLWADGLYRLDPRDNTTSYLELDDSNSVFHGANVLQIKVDKKNNLWIGTFGDGIFYYDQQKKKLTRHQTNPEKENALTSERIRTMLLDSHDRLWIGGDVGGLNLFNETTGSFEKIEYKNILTKNSNILNLMESHDGKIWIGTVSAGAIVYDPKSKKAWSEHSDSTLVNSVVNAMLEDKNGKIWMSTSNGICKYDPTTKTSVVYTKDDGLQGNHFNSGSALKCSNGMLLFGGITGWNAFYPDSIHATSQFPKIVFTDFWLNNIPTDVNSPNSPLSAAINEVKSIELNHDQNSFSIEFAALEYNFSKKTTYAYLLEPFNDRWQYNGNERKITFTNLFPGRYVLRIKATDKDGRWFTKESPLVITIHQAWWQTTSFRAMTALAVLVLFYVIFRLRLQYLIQQRKNLTKEIQFHTAELKSKNIELAELNGEILSQNEELTSQNEQITTQREELELTHRKLEEANENLEELVKHRTEKLEDTIQKLDKTVSELDRFVYSASHDLSAPLKSILGLVNIAKMETDQKIISQYHDYIEMSILKLERVIKNLVEFSRNSHLEIRLSSFSFSDLVNDVVQELAFWPEARKVNIINVSETTLALISDEQRMKVILHNLIGNAIKYADVTKPESYIKIGCQQKGSTWLIHIADNGIGIDEKYQKKVFEMYYRATDRSQGSGLGLFIVREIVHKLGGEITMESVRATGTDFYIELPVIKLVTS